MRHRMRFVLAVMVGCLLFAPSVAGAAILSQTYLDPQDLDPGLNLQGMDIQYFSHTYDTVTGFHTFALDMYGKGVRAKTPEEAAKLSGIYKGDRPLMRARAQAGLDELRKQPLVDPARIAAIGYCFGGTTVLELARSGADVAGVVSFHGGLGTPQPADAKNIKGKVLVLHGADDPHVPPAEVAAFQDEMRKAAVDWQMIYYGGAVHSFTNPGSGTDASTGVAYNEKADKRSWEAMKAFFKELF